MICLLVYLIPQDGYQSMVFHHRINSIFISYVLLFADAKKVSACKFSFMLYSLKRHSSSEHAHISPRINGPIFIFPTEYTIEYTWSDSDQQVLSDQVSCLDF